MKKWGNILASTLDIRKTLYRFFIYLQTPIHSPQTRKRYLYLNWSNTKQTIRIFSFFFFDQTQATMFSFFFFLIKTILLKWYVKSLLHCVANKTWLFLVVIHKILSSGRLVELYNPWGPHRLSHAHCPFSVRSARLNWMIPSSNLLCNSNLLYAPHRW